MTVRFPPPRRALVRPRSGQASREREALLDLFDDFLWRMAQGPRLPQLSR
ncbi:MAG: hypothetical protein ACT4PT_02995 [Methanobacteriota archaeon]